MGNIANFQQANGQPKYHINSSTFEPYLQDDYHIFKNLTLNVGVRISLFGTFWGRRTIWSPIGTRWLITRPPSRSLAR